MNERKLPTATEADRVHSEDVEAMIDRLYIEFVDRPGGSNATFAHAFLDGFLVASGMSACVDSRLFDQRLGREAAASLAIQNARNKLWELEGWVLHCRRQGRFDAVKASVPLGEDGPLLAAGVAPRSDIGFAMEALREGKRVARGAWGQEGEKWLSMTWAYRVKAEQFWSLANREYAAMLPDGIADVPASITMKTGPGEISMGWHASPADVLAFDWYVVEEKAAAPRVIHAHTYKHVPLEAR